MFEQRIKTKVRDKGQGTSRNGGR